jgi:uncharacterized membrane protein YGL010W
VRHLHRMYQPTYREWHQGTLCHVSYHMICPQARLYACGHVHHTTAMSKPPRLLLLTAYVVLNVPLQTAYVSVGFTACHMIMAVLVLIAWSSVQVSHTRSHTTQLLRQGGSLPRPRWSFPR